MTNDMINGTFEICGAFVVLLSVRELIKDKCYAGLSVWNIIFFTSWGLWNVFYYPSINQHWSFVGGCALAVSNLIYLFCIWYYPHRTIELEIDIQQEP